MKKLLLCLLCFSLLLTSTAWAGAEPQTGSTPREADNITSQCTVYCNGGLLGFDALDNSYFTRMVLPAGSVLKVTCATPIAGVYIRFDQIGCDGYPEPWALEVDGEVRDCGDNGYMQQYEGDFSATELTITFPAETGISDIVFLSEGTLPEYVHDWESEPERVDLLLMACHSDDDQYIFAGLIPWCLAQGVSVQVAYFINHYTHPNRVHEQLDGLWASGLRTYPALGHYRDEEHDTTLQSYLDTGVTEEQLIGTQVEVIRRYQPQIVVTHAQDGEYGHGAHVLYTELILKAIELTGDASQYPESSEAYGVWDIPKVYVHCYEENPVTLDFDTPLPLYDGRTAFKVGQDAFLKEVSQTWYEGQMNWLYGQELATEVKDYRPVDYGLYRTLVGADSSSDTLLDNIVLYTEQARLAEEEAQRLAEEEAAAKAAQEEAARLAAEAEAARQAEEAAAQNAGDGTAVAAGKLESYTLAPLSSREKLIRTAGVAVPVLLLVLALVLLCRPKRRALDFGSDDDYLPSGERRDGGGRSRRSAPPVSKKPRRSDLPRRHHEEK